MKHTHLLFFGLCICLLGGIVFPLQAQPYYKAAKVLPKKAELSPSITKSTYMYSRGLNATAAKVALNTRFAYQEEIQHASELYKRIQNASRFGTNSASLRQDIQNNIVNQTLRKSMLKHLEKDHPASMMQELAAYYHLEPSYIPTFNATLHPSETFAWNALLYLTNHPHKPTWALRHVLKTDGVDEPLKKAIREFIRKNKILPDEYNKLLSLLREAHEQYTDILKDASAAPSVVETVAIYKELADSLEVFTATHNRAPLWENEGEERDLFNRVGTLLYVNQVNQFEAIMPHLERLYILTEKYPTSRYSSEQETLEEVKRFKEKYNRIPQGVLLREHLTPLPPQEAMLYESMLYWKQHSASFNQQLNKLIFPHQENYYPPYF